MQYIVKTKGDVINRASESYIIEAENELAAQNEAKNLFASNNYAIEESISASCSKRVIRAYISWALMAIAIGLSFYGWELGHQLIKIGPNVISCIYAVIFYSAFVIRFKGIKATVMSYIDVVSALLVILLLSAFIRVILREVTIGSFLNMEIRTDMLVVVAIILSWLGVKIASLICYGVIALLAMANVITLSDAMGPFGAVFVLAAFFGILFYLSIEPACDATLNGIKTAIFRGKVSVERDIYDVRTKMDEKKKEQQESKEEPVKEIEEKNIEQAEFKTEDIKEKEGVE